MGKVFFLERTIDIRLKDSYEQNEMRALSENMTVHCWPVCIINMNHADEHSYSSLLLSVWMSVGICHLHFHYEHFIFTVLIANSCNSKYI